MKATIFLVLFVLSAVKSLPQSLLTENKDAFNLLEASIVIDANDDSLIHIAARLFQKDVEMVSGSTVSIVTTPLTKRIILIGTINNSRLIKQLIREKKIHGSDLKDQWEGYRIQVVKNPFKEIDEALVIAGSDRRGTAYGVFELSRQIGVSPWYWWADVPVKKKNEIYINTNSSLSDAPKVKYRGIFINDEAPALSNWSREKFGGFNHTFYEKVFELILRLKGNYLWPAMWGNAFYDDDLANKQSADNFGIVIGTSHHEPILRAHDEWRRYGNGKWDYDSNAVELRKYWKGSMERAKGTETIVSIGMRGDGDKPMTPGTATALLERIVKDQREIIKDVTGKDASKTPQLWALYKEVQDYYDKGMRVPDDVTLLLCDDNWGNIRKLPCLTDKPRAGGYGIYYHFDYVGGPRNYKWINTNNIARVWEQMHLAYEYGVKNIWIVNVGDIKPMEFPISFFLDYAWDPSKWNEDNLRNYYTNWANDQFGSKFSKDIGEMIRKYSQIAARRKPELLDANTYSLKNYQEAVSVNYDLMKLTGDAIRIASALPKEYFDSYYQLVLHPLKALTNLYNLYYFVAKGIPTDAKRMYINDSLITLEYHGIAKGKWNHMMSQTHIGYTSWQQPPNNRMPEVKYMPATEDSMDAAIIKGNTNFPKNALIEIDKYVSFEADHWSNIFNTDRIKWKVIPDIGKTGNGITTFPVTLAPSQLEQFQLRVEYDFYSVSAGEMKVNLYFSPTLNFHNDEGLKFGVSIDDEQPQIFSLNKETNQVRTWEKWVANNIIIKTSTHSIKAGGKHTLKYWMISPGVILQKVVIDFGGVKPSYLGPPETRN